MPEYLAPGVYVEEKDTGAKAIEGVSTTTSGMVGITERGPEGVPTLVIGFADFRRQFGGLLDRRVYTAANWYLPHAVDGFFTNGGKRLYITRVLPKAATRAEATLFDRGAAGGPTTELAAPTRVGDGALLVTDDTGIADGDWLKVEDGENTEYVRVLDATNAAALTRRRGSHFAHAIGEIATEGSATATVVGAALAVNAGAAVIQLTLPTAVTLPAGQVLQIGTSPDDEYAIVKAPTNLTAAAQGNVDLRYPLSVNHGAGNVATVSFGATANPPALLTPMAAGDRLFAASAGFGNAPVVVEFKGPTPLDLEYDVVTPVAGARFNKGVRYTHPTDSLVEVVSVPTSTPIPIAQDATAGSMVIMLGGAGSFPATVPATTHRYLQVGPATAGATTEFVELAGFDSVTNTATLREPLAFDHLIGEEVVDVPAFTATASMPLAAPLAPEQTVLLTSSSLPNPSVIRLVDSDAAKTEYRMVTGLPTVSAISTGIPVNGPNPAVSVPITFEHSAQRALAGREVLIAVEAIDRGTWGDGLRVIAEDDDPLLDTTATDPRPQSATDIKLRTVVGVETGTVLEVGYTPASPGTPAAPGTLLKVTAVSPSTAKVSFGAPIGIPVNPGDRVRTREFRLFTQLVQINPATNKPRVIESEGHRHLSMDPRHTRYFAKVIGHIFRTDVQTPREADGRTQGESDLIRVEDVLLDGSGNLPAAAETTIRLGPDLNTDTLPDGRIVPVPSRLSGGDDSIATVDDDTYIGTDDLNPQDRLGLFALKNIEEISIVAIPGRTTQKVQQALLDHCELRHYCFAVLDAGPGEKVAEVQEHRSLYDSKYGAIYHPWLTIDDPFPDNPRVRGQIAIPPSGHVIGIYARSDIERGVHKAPANEVVRGIAGLVASLAKEHQDILNPRNINVIRDFRPSGRGVRVWGARALSSDPDWKYINVRRLFIFMEHSIDRGTQWVVFEPNSELLWARVRRVISSFLRAVWRDGALMGLTAEEAYFVKCDRTTMSQNDIDNGRLIVEIGVAPVKPAEFVIFRIGQWSGGSSVDEG
jgi:phage tail sheath protein FI